jgi:hypothetical protein
MSPSVDKKRLNRLLANKINPKASSSALASLILFPTLVSSGDFTMIPDFTMG